MQGVEIIVFLLVVIVAFSAIVERLKIPQSIMLVFVGLIIGFTPQLPDMVLKPEVVFLIFLPPLLFTAAWKLSWNDFKAEKRSVISLATGLVFFTTVAIAVVAHYFIPGFSWQLGFVLGAVISPPDAVAAGSITKGLNLNRRVVTILDGESLVNDASALVAYRYAIASIVTGGFVFWEASLQFLLVAVGGVAVGLIVGWCLSWAHKRIHNDATIEVALTILTPYVAYLFAEHIHLSGVLAVVSAGLFLSFRSPEAFSYQTRIQANSFWETIEFLLNGFVFILIGMQLPAILADIEHGSLLAALGYGFLITTVAILVRIIWVFPGAYLPVWLSRRKNRPEPMDWRHVAIISWTGMRGVVSLASALAIPLTLANGEAFPQRDMILFITFCVIFLTLVVHGLSLRILIKFLKIKSDPVKQQEQENLVRRVIAEEAILYIDRNITAPKVEPDVIHRLRSRYEINLRSATENSNELKDLTGKSASLRLRQYAVAQKEVINYERAILIQLHKDDKAPTDIMKKIEYELDIEESRISEQIKRVKI